MEYNNKFIIGLGIVFALFLIILLFGVVWQWVIDTANYIGDVGLKTILETIWNGKGN